MVKHGTLYLQNLTATPATIIIILTAVCFGLVPWFAKALLNNGIEPSAIALFRYLATTLILFSTLQFRGLLNKETLWAIFSDICVGLGWIQILAGLLGMVAILITPAISSKRRITHFDNRSSIDNPVCKVNLLPVTSLRL